MRTSIFGALIFCMVSSSLAYDQIVPSSFQTLYPNVPESKINSLTIQVNNQKTIKRAKQVLNNWIDENWVSETILKTATTQESVTEEPMETESTKKSMFPNIPGAHLSLESMPHGAANPYEAESKRTTRMVFGQSVGEPTKSSRDKEFRSFIGEKVFTRSHAERIQNAPQFNPDSFGEQRQPTDWEEVYWLKLVNATSAPDSSRFKRDCNPSKEFAKKQGSAFLDQREALKKLVQFIFRESQKDDFLSKTEALKMRKLFWEADHQNNNNLMLTESAFFNEIVAQFWNRPNQEIYFRIRGYVNSFREDQSNAKKLNWSAGSDKEC